MREGCHSERGWATTRGGGEPSESSSERTIRHGRPCPAPRSGSSAKALLLTVLGELVLPHGGVGVDVDGRAHDRPCSTSRSATPARPSPASPRSAPLRSEKDGPPGPLAPHRRRATPARRAAPSGSTSSAPATTAGTAAGSSCCARSPRSSGPSATSCGPSSSSPASGSSPPASPCPPTSTGRAAANAVLAELGLLPGAMVFRAEAGELRRGRRPAGPGMGPRHPGRLVHGVRRRLRGPRPADRRGPLRRPRRAGPRLAPLPVHRPRHPGPPAPAPLARPHRPRRLRRAPRRLVARRHRWCIAAEAASAPDSFDNFLTVQPTNVVE